MAHQGQRHAHHAPPIAVNSVLRQDFQPGFFGQRPKQPPFAIQVDHRIQRQRIASPGVRIQHPDIGAGPVQGFSRRVQQAHGGDGVGQAPDPAGPHGDGSIISDVRCGGGRVGQQQAHVFQRSQPIVAVRQRAQVGGADPGPVEHRLAGQFQRIRQARIAGQTGGHNDADLPVRRIGRHQQGQLMCIGRHLRPQGLRQRNHDKNS